MKQASVDKNYRFRTPDGFRYSWVSFKLNSEINY